MAISKPDASTSQINNNFVNLEAAQAEFYANDSGPYTAPSGITNGFQQLSSAELISIGASAIVDQGLVNRSHVEYLYESIFYPSGPTPQYKPLTNETYISLTASGLVALSRGNITLRSSSMSDAPVINPNVSPISPIFQPYHQLNSPSSSTTPTRPTESSRFKPSNISARSLQTPTCPYSPPAP